MGKARPVTPAERQQVAELHAAGKSRAAIARQLKRSPDTIGAIARDQGLEWDRAKTAAATEAKQQDNRARRSALISRLYDRADKVLTRLEADTFQVVTERRDGSGGVRVNPITADAIPAMDEKQLGGMAANYLLTAARLETLDSDDGAAKAKGVLGQLAEGFQSLYGQLGDGGKAVE